MKLESAQFERRDLAVFLEELVDRDRRHLIRRLRAASSRLGRLGPLATSTRGAPGAWSAHEVLAHIAVLSKFYGVVTYQVATGRVREVDLLGGVRLRDSMGKRFAGQTGSELLASALADHQRTIDFLKIAEPRMLRRRATMKGLGSMSAEEICRLSLCTHLEQHLDQLEAALR